MASQGSGFRWPIKQEKEEGGRAKKKGFHNRGQSEVVSFRELENREKTYDTEERQGVTRVPWPEPEITCKIEKD